MDGECVTPKSWYQKTIFTIPIPGREDIEVNAIDMSVATIVIIAIVVLCCCYCSWRNKKQIAETGRRVSMAIRRTISGEDEGDKGAKYSEASQIDNKGMHSGQKQFLKEVIKENRQYNPDEAEGNNTDRAEEKKEVELAQIQNPTENDIEKGDSSKQ